MENQIQDEMETVIAYGSQTQMLFETLPFQDLCRAGVFRKFDFQGLAQRLGCRDSLLSALVQGLVFGKLASRVLSAFA